MHVVLVVPMNPEFLPEAALLLGGVIGLGVGIRHLASQRVRRGIQIAALSVVCVALAFAMGRSKVLHSPKMANLPRNQATAGDTK